MPNVEHFWNDLDSLMEAAVDLEDADAEEMLIDFLEDYRRMWPSVVASMRGDRRVLIERVVAILEAGP
jgi:hypothetical protein